MEACVCPKERGLSQLLQSSRGVYARRQKKDQWGPAAGTLHNLQQVDRDGRVSKEGEKMWESKSQHGVTDLTPDGTVSELQSYLKGTNEMYETFV